MKLTQNLNQLHTYAVGISEDVPGDAVLLILLSKLSQVAMLNRVKVKSFESETLSNLYILNFMPSGTGKDKVVSLIDKHLMHYYFSVKVEKEQAYKEIKLKELEGVAEDSEMTDLQKNRFIKENEPRQLIDIFQNATIEGFVAVRKEFESAKFGGTLVIISEFSDYILNLSTTKEDFLTIIKEVYEDGSNYAKVIKMEKRGESVQDVPCSILFQSTPTGLFEEPGVSKMKSFLNKGIARRALICMPDMSETKVPYNNFVEYKESLALLESQKEKMQKIIARAANINPVKNVFICTEEVDKFLFDLRPVNINFEGNESLIADLKSRPRKIQKLAGIIALIEHPAHNIVNMEDIACAASIVNHYSQYLNAFIDLLYEDKTMKLFNYILSKKGIGARLMDIRQQKIVGWNNFSRWFEEAINEVRQYALLNGYELKDIGIGSIGSTYILNKNDGN